MARIRQARAAKSQSASRKKRNIVAAAIVTVLVVVMSASFIGLLYMIKSDCDMTVVLAHPRSYNTIDCQ